MSLLPEGISSISELATLCALGLDFACRNFGFTLSLGDFALGGEDAWSSDIARATSSSEVSRDDLPFYTTTEASINCAAQVQSITFRGAEEWTRVL